MKDWIAVHTWDEEGDRERFAAKYGEPFSPTKNSFRTPVKRWLGQNVARLGLARTPSFFVTGRRQLTRQLLMCLKVRV